MLTDAASASVRPLFTKSLVRLAGILIVLALSLLTPYFYFIPKAALAAVIICAVIFMIEYEVVKPMWKSSRKYRSERSIGRCACVHC